MPGIELKAYVIARKRESDGTLATVEAQMSVASYGNDKVLVQFWDSKDQRIPYLFEMNAADFAAMGAAIATHNTLKS